MLQDLKEKNPWKAGRRPFFVGKLVLFCLEQFNPPKKNTHKNTPLKLGVCVPKLGFGSSRCVLSCSKWKMDGFYFQVTMDFIYFWIFFRCLEILAQKKKHHPFEMVGFSWWWIPWDPNPYKMVVNVLRKFSPKLLHKALPSNQGHASYETKGAIACCVFCVNRHLCFQGIYREDTVASGDVWTYGTSSITWKWSEILCWPLIPRHAKSGSNLGALKTSFQ